MRLLFQRGFWTSLIAGGLGICLLVLPACSPQTAEPESPSSQASESSGVTAIPNPRAARSEDAQIRIRQRILRERLAEQNARVQRADLERLLARLQQQITDLTTTTSEAGSDVQRSVVGVGQSLDEIDKRVAQVNVTVAREMMEIRTQIRDVERQIEEIEVTWPTILSLDED